VLVRNSEVIQAQQKDKTRYLGPYEVCRRTEGGSYVLKELDGSIMQQGVAALDYSLMYLDTTKSYLKR